MRVVLLNGMIKEKYDLFYARNGFPYLGSGSTIGNAVTSYVSPPAITICTSPVLYE